MFFELREYHCLPGKHTMGRLMKEIIPYQIAKGMVITGSFIVKRMRRPISIRRLAGKKSANGSIKRSTKMITGKKRCHPALENFSIAKAKVTRMNATPKSVMR